MLLAAWCATVETHSRASLHAATYTDERTGLHYLRKMTFFENYNIGASYGTTTGYVYDAPNLNGINDGWVSIPDAVAISLQVGIDSMSPGTYTVRVEGITGKDTRPCEIVSKVYTAATTIDEIIMISEQVRKIRVGLNYSTTNASVIYLYGLAELRN